MRGQTVDHDRHRPRLVAAALPLVLLALGCSDDGGGGAASTTTVATSPGGLPQGDDPVDLDPADFTVDIDHELWPMAPGDRWVYEEVDEDGEVLEVIVTVTSETREIANGITARVVRDTVTLDGELIEDTFDWYAQDADGNIWYLGEDTAEYEDGEMTTTAGSFEAGVDGALPGIALPAEPVVGMRYRQEYYEGEAEDSGEILALDEVVEIELGRFDHLLRTKDVNGLDPDALEHKLYAPGIGPLLTLDLTGGGREELVDHFQVPAEIAEAAGTTPLGQHYS